MTLVPAPFHFRERHEMPAIKYAGHPIDYRQFFELVGLVRSAVRSYPHGNNKGTSCYRFATQLDDTDWYWARFGRGCGANLFDNSVLRVTEQNKKVRHQANLQTAA